MEMSNSQSIVRSNAILLYSIAKTHENRPQVLADYTSKKRKKKNTVHITQHYIASKME